MKIGNLELAGNVFLAPMVGISDPPFRKIVQKFGVSAVWTEMISADGVARAPSTFRTMETLSQEVPTVFQIAGKDPDLMAEAARRIQDLGAAAIDVNMGCPARKVVGRGAGAALMRNVPLAGRIVAAMRKVLSVPLTVKIRSGWDDENPNAAAMARVIEVEGADALIVHSRSKSKAHSGPPSLDVLEEVKRSVGIPVIGNGGIQHVEDAVIMAARTGCDGVMVGRGAVGRPWLPGWILERSVGRAGISDRVLTFFDVIREHFGYMLEWWDLRNAVRHMHKHLAWYSKGFAQGSDFRRTVFTLEDPDALMHFAEKFFEKVAIS
ncbi:MAG: tRNA dihydrouridine synthase DusB [Desulfomonilaceae bacterium]